jgi:hypothetical protein
MYRERLHAERVWDTEDAYSGRPRRLSRLRIWCGGDSPVWKVSAANSSGGRGEPLSPAWRSCSTGPVRKFVASRGTEVGCAY